jgi:alanine racemase
MKMYKVFIEGWREHLVGKVEMEYLVMVFGDKAQVTEIELTQQKSSANLIADERSN